MTATRGAPPHGPPGGMGQPVERSDATDASFRRLLGYLRPHRARLGASGLLVLAASLLQLAGPWLQGVAIDDFIAVGRPGRPRR